MNAVDALADLVLDRYAVELAEADSLQLHHLAQRAEAPYATGLGDRMRELVDIEQAGRRWQATMHAAEREGWATVADRMERWEAAGCTGHWLDEQYGDPCSAVRP